jgi:Holliday junction resolvase RusA-like endonuclease
MYSQKELREKIGKLREIICSHELIRYQLYEELSDLEHRSMDEIGPPIGRLPICHLLEIDEVPFDLIQFSYEGILPVYEKESKYKNTVRDYYIQSTIQALTRTNINIQFSKAVIYICHYFQDLSIRDLDNRNRKVIIDAVRKTGMIDDDSWQKVSFIESGFYDSENHLEVYVFGDQHLTDFLQWFNKTCTKTER